MIKAHMEVLHLKLYRKEDQHKIKDQKVKRKSSLISLKLGNCQFLNEENQMKLMKILKRKNHTYQFQNVVLLKIKVRIH